MFTRFNKILHLFLITLFCQFSLHGQVRLPTLFSSNMVLQQNSSVPVWGWAKPQSRIEITTSWNNNVVEVNSDREGNWEAVIPTDDHGGPYSMTFYDGDSLIIENILLGEVWLCAGQSNMEMPMKGFRSQPIEGSNLSIVKSSNPKIRMVSVPRKSTSQLMDDFEGSWEIAEPATVANFSATAWHFGNLLNEVLGVPVGLIDVSYGGSCIQAWMSKNTTVDFEDKSIPQSDEDIREPNRTPSALFNGMLNPVIGFGIKGAIWYQGETNYQEPDLYLSLFPTMVEEWRELWAQGVFPFYYAQIAPFDYKVFRNNEIIEKHNSAYLRDAQRLAETKIPNSGMAVLLDIGHETNIHPPKKKEVGERLAFWALSDTYGIKGITHHNPAFKEFVVEGSVVTVSFDHVDLGLHSYDQEITLFEMAGEDRKFYPAKAVLRSRSILLSSPQVSEPVSVRYAFDDYVEAQVFNNAGLPLSSFRTDDW